MFGVPCQQSIFATMDLYEENFEQEYKREQAGKKLRKDLALR